MPTIILNHVSFSYASTPVLSDVSMRVSDGERACLIGPNGCGKTTLLRIVSGALLPERGTVTVDNAAVTNAPDINEFRGSIGDYLDAAIHYELLLIVSMMLPCGSLPDLLKQSKTMIVSLPE